MRRTRNYQLEKDILRFLKSEPTAPNSATIAAKVGAHIEHVRLALMDLSTDKLTQRSRSGRYRLVSTSQRHADPLKGREIPASSG